MKKSCKTCNIKKDYSDFSKSKRHKDGYFKECKKCISITRRKHYEENCDRTKEVNKKYYEANKEEIYKKIDKSKKKINDKKYYDKNAEKLKEKKRKYYESNKEIIKENSRKYYDENKETINKPNERKRELQREYYKKRKHQYAWREILRKTLMQMDIIKNETTLELIGYDYDELRENLQDKFHFGMTWENHGDWHIDHIIPISKFKKGTPPNIVNRLDNLRPLWKKDNIKRQNNISDDDYIKYKYLFDELSDYIIY